MLSGIEINPIYVNLCRLIALKWSFYSPEDYNGNNFIQHRGRGQISCIDFKWLLSPFRGWNIEAVLCPLRLSIVELFFSIYKKLSKN